MLVRHPDGTYLEATPDPAAIRAAAIDRTGRPAPAPDIAGRTVLAAFVDADVLSPPGNIGATLPGAAPRGATPADTAPSGAAQSGTAPSGMAPSGTAPSDAVSGGAAPSGAAPSGNDLGGVTPAVAVPGGGVAAAEGSVALLVTGHAPAPWATARPADLLAALVPEHALVPGDRSDQSTSPRT